MAEIIAWCNVCKSKNVMLEPITQKHTKHNRYSYIGYCKCGSRISAIKQENNNNSSS